MYACMHACMFVGMCMYEYRVYVCIYVSVCPEYHPEKRSSFRNIVKRLHITNSCQPIVCPGMSSR